MPIKRVPVTLPSIFALLFFLGGTALADATRLSESGSTLLYPLMNSWANAYSDDHPDVAIDTFASGSGAGIAAAISGSTQLGASDAPLKDSQLEQQGTRMLNIPVAVSAQQVNFNVPELNGVTLKLNGTVLAGIYTGAIAMWDDRRIAALNAGTLLPHRGIIPIRRAE